MSLKHDLLVLGSQNRKEKDQKLKRSEIRPVQMLTRNGDLKPVSFFNDWGKVGVSSIAWDGHFPNQMFVSGNEYVTLVNMETKEYQPLDIGPLSGLHDINFIDEKLWITNTGLDELIVYDVENQKVIEKKSLDKYRKNLDEEKEDGSYEKVEDRFHCNQVFKNYEGDLCILIHHVYGWQFYRILFEMMVKKQGDGGVINLDTGEVLPLNLKSPHSVRMLNDEYWIQDSTGLCARIFDRNWELKEIIETGGFGRGMDFSEEEDIAYIGLSATRKRYLKVIPTSDYHSNRVYITDIKNRKKLDEIPIPNIEQLDNIYILDKKMKEVFERFM